MRRQSIRIVTSILVATFFTQTPTRLGAEGENIERFTFTRSGGLVAAPGMTVSATVDVDGQRTRDWVRFWSGCDKNAKESGNIGFNHASVVRSKRLDISRSW